MIRVNRSAEIDIRTLPTGESIAVVDNFLVAPDELREHAARHTDDFVMPPRSYPGRILSVDAAAMADIYRFIRSTLAPRFDFLRGGGTLQSLLSITTLKGEQLSNLQRLCHTDPPTAKGRLNYAFVVYLFGDERLGGTAFYRWKDRDSIVEATALENDDPDRALAFLRERYPMFSQPPCYMSESNEIAERLDHVPARYNRMLFYSGDIPHNAHITEDERLTDNIETGRLTLNGFASLRPREG